MRKYRVENDLFGVLGVVDEVEPDVLKYWCNSVQAVVEGRMGKTNVSWIDRIIGKLDDIERVNVLRKIESRICYLAENYDDMIRKVLSGIEDLTGYFLKCMMVYPVVVYGDPGEEKVCGVCINVFYGFSGKYFAYVKFSCKKKKNVILL